LHYSKIIFTKVEMEILEGRIRKYS
jgi:hypothetical protein